MKLRRVITDTLKNKRFWTWQIVGAIIYIIPAVIRYSTGIVALPILNFPGFWIDHIIPGNMLEKVLVNAFFPGGAGAIAGEVFAVGYLSTVLSRREKYLVRLGGALGETAVWSTIQFFGFYLLISGPAGGGNLFESVFVFPINFVLATFSIFTPDVVHLANQGVRRIRRNLSSNASEKS